MATWVLRPTGAIPPDRGPRSAGAAPGAARAHNAPPGPTGPRSRCSQKGGSIGVNALPRTEEGRPRGHNTVGIGTRQSVPASNDQHPAHHSGALFFGSASRDWNSGSSRRLSQSGSCRRSGTVMPLGNARFSSGAPRFRGCCRRAPRCGPDVLRPASDSRHSVRSPKGPSHTASSPPPLRWFDPPLTKPL